MAERGFALVVWCEPGFCWASVCVSEKRELLVELCERLRLFGPGEFRVIEAASVEDDAVEVAGEALPWPAGFAYLNHESYGIE